MQLHYALGRVLGGGKWEGLLEGLAHLIHEVCVRRDGEEGTSSKVKVHQDLSEGGPVLRLGLPGDKKGM